jgi:hypothetical protein
MNLGLKFPAYKLWRTHSNHNNEILYAKVKYKSTLQHSQTRRSKPNSAFVTLHVHQRLKAFGACQLKMPEGWEAGWRVWGSGRGSMLLTGQTKCVCCQSTECWQMNRGEGALDSALRSHQQGQSELSQRWLRVEHWSETSKEPWRAAGKCIHLLIGNCRPSKAPINVAMRNSRPN